MAIIIKFHWIPATPTNIDEWEELGMVISMQSTMSKKILLLDAGVYLDTRKGHNLKIKYPFVASVVKLMSLSCKPCHQFKDKGSTSLGTTTYYCFMLKIEKHYFI